MKCTYTIDGDKISILYDGNTVSFDTTFEIKDDTLNVRDSASTNAAAIDAIAGGQEVNIIGANADESWYQIQYGTKSGWISANKEYVQVIY